MSIEELIARVAELEALAEDLRTQRAAAEELHTKRTEELGDYARSYRLTLKKQVKMAKRIAELEEHESELIEERDRFSDALQAAHVALGGDGEWVARPGQTLLAGETGDLSVDIPAIASQQQARIAELEAKVEAEQARADRLHVKNTKWAADFVQLQVRTSELEAELRQANGLAEQMRLRGMCLTEALVGMVEHFVIHDEEGRVTRVDGLATAIDLLTELGRIKDGRLVDG